MKIVFLDIDGPINNPRVNMAGYKYDPINVKIFNKFFKQKDVLVVLASCERIIYRDAEHASKGLFKNYHLEFKFHEQWRTGTNYGAGDGQRARELQEWIDINHQEGYEYVSIDDDLVTLPNVTQIKANLNGISFLNILLLESLYIEKRKKDYISQLDWEKKQNFS